jgi:hypothetical protein
MTLLLLGIMMAAALADDTCINFVGMKFIDNTLYFIGESKATGQIQGSDKCIQLEKTL